jgi:uncharacterized membrane protein YcjF (UPF0283 family)
MQEVDWYGMALFFGALLIVLAGFGWMVRVNARDLMRLEGRLRLRPRCRRFRS